MGSETTPWVEGHTIGSALRETAIRHGSNDALVFPSLGYRRTYEAFDREVDQVARGLSAIGLEHGDRLAVWSTNCPEWVLLQFASARIGVILVTVNPAYRSHELEYVLKQSEAKTLALGRGFRAMNYFTAIADLCPSLGASDTRFLSELCPNLRSVLSMVSETPAGIISWQEMLDRGSSIGNLAELERKTSPREAINIQYTSGTTGFPKGATLTHRNLLFNVYYAGACQRLSDADRICIPVPLYHCFGCVLGTLCAMVHGAAMVLPHEAFDAGKTLDAIEQEKCTSIYGVPTMFIAEIEHKSFPERNLSSLRTGIMAGSPCPIELMKKVTTAMHASEITIGYGQTEASPLVTQTRFDDPIERRVGTVGRPIPGVELKIYDPVTGDSLPDNVPGELCARGHPVMIGYYNMPAETARAIDSEGWLHTGDIGLRMPDGYYRITGRIKDMIIRGGENIYPREIEEFLYAHPKVEEVQVIGVPDTKYGEQVMAWIKLKEGQTSSVQEIQDYCRASMAHFKTPHYIKFVQQFPMTVTGKIQKFKMREIAVDELKLDQASRIETA